MKQRVIALIDCDSFYVSCERKDNPSLEHKPVCVMTGTKNKGIIISRSQEAKDLGIKMGMPYFKIKDTHKNVICIPARMERYEEISSEVMQIINTFSSDIEITSIDEAYIDLTGLNRLYHTSYTNIIKNIRQTILAKTGIPVSIGLSCSKILAKLASDKAKNNAGIFVIHPDEIINVIANIGIGEICGIGYKNSQRMQFNGIFTVNDFITQDNRWIRNVFGINGLCLKHELCGMATSLVNSKPSAPQSIQDSRSFEDFSSSLEFLRHNLNIHIHKACQKLRYWNGFCTGIEIILKTKDFRYSTSGTKFPSPTNSDFVIKKSASQLLEMLYKPNVMYRSIGITLKQLTYGENKQLSFFETMHNHDDKLSHAIDNLEKKFGYGIVKNGF